MAGFISMWILLQGKQSRYRFRRDPRGQAAKVPGSTEEDELAFVPVVVAVVKPTLGYVHTVSSAKMNP